MWLFWIVDITQRQSCATAGRQRVSERSSVTSDRPPFVRFSLHHVGRTPTSSQDKTCQTVQRKINRSRFMRVTGHIYINIRRGNSGDIKNTAVTFSDGGAAERDLKECSCGFCARAHLAVPSPSGHPWSWVHWSGCSLCSGGGLLSSHWSPAPGARTVWGARPSGNEPILRSLVQSTSPGPPVGQSPSQTLQLPHAERKQGKNRNYNQKCIKGATSVQLWQGHGSLTCAPVSRAPFDINNLIFSIEHNKQTILTTHFTLNCIRKHANKKSWH